MKNLKIGSKIFIQIISAVIAGLIILSYFSYNTMQKESQKQAENLLTSIGKFHASEVEEAFSSYIGLIKGLEEIVVGLQKDGVRDRQRLINMMRFILQENPKVLSVWIGWEPNAYDGRDSEYVDTYGHDETGRFVTVVSRKNDEIVLSPLVNYETSAYYQTAKRTLKEVVVNPYLYDFGGDIGEVLLTSVSVPIVIDGEFYGVIGMDIPLKEFSSYFNGIKTWGDGRVFVLSGDTKFVSHPNLDYIGEDALPKMSRFKTFESILDKGQSVITQAYSGIFKDEAYFSFTPIILGENEEKWTVVLQIPEKNLFAAANSASRTLLIICAVIFFLFTILASTIATSITKPIVSLNQVIAKLDEGDTNIEIPYTNRKDELGDIANAIETFKQNQIHQDNLEANERLRQQKESAEANRIRSLTQQYEIDNKDILEQVVCSANDLEKTAISMSDTAKNTNDQSYAVSIAIKEASDNIQSVATSTEELSASISEILRQIQNQNKITKNATENAQLSQDAVNRLLSSSDTIASVLSLITDIANQTNLLALNANIEAARAGDAGKGFSVVANEVKTLANQTSEATEEISRHIKTMQLATSETAESVTNIAEVISDINNVSASIYAAMGQQSSATQEISSNIQQASIAVQDVTTNIALVSASAEQTGVASSTVLDASKILNEKNKEMEQTASRFLNEIKKKS